MFKLNLTSLFQQELLNTHYAPLALGNGYKRERGKKEEICQLNGGKKKLKVSCQEQYDDNKENFQ